jgi:ribose transport system permease protein
VRPADLSRHRPLLHQRRHRGFEYGQSFPTLEWLTAGRTLGVPHSFIMFLVVAAVMGLVLHRSVFGRYLFAVGKNEEAARYSGIRTERDRGGGLHHQRRAGRPVVDLSRDVHALDLAGEPRQFLRALRHRRRRAGRLLAARRRGSILGIVLGAILLQILQNLVTCSASRARSTSR